MASAAHLIFRCPNTIRQAVARSKCHSDTCQRHLPVRRKKPAGALWGRAARRPHGGRCWAEVYCGSAESGSWVHADPVSGAIDRCVLSVMLTST